MEPRIQAAFQALQQAQTARKQGNKTQARHFAEQALQLAPELEEPWLMMAALASPRASVAYLEKALQINPASQRARQGMAWALKRLRAQPRPTPTPPQPASVTPAQSNPPAAAPHPAPPAPAPAPVQAKPAPAPRRRLSPLLALAVLCLALMVAAGLGSVTPALAFIRNSLEVTPTEVVSWGQADIAKPSYTPTFTPTPTPTDTPTPTPTFTPTPTPTDTPTPTATPTETPTP
ncbi:MAG: hypothetical protein WHV44_14640, partial [Anaerolineales bacterium]